jgi:SAM-dependent methyltransferase
MIVEVGYRAVLQRAPDPWGRRDFLGRFRSGDLTVEQFGRELLESPEYERVRAARDLVRSLHHSRCAFVRGLPRARRILDLGGTNLQHEDGAMVTMGYPYAFEELVIVDLPPEDRHPLYNRGGVRSDTQSRLGKITYAYHSMEDLSAYPDESFDLVYSGQSVEHVPVDVADNVVEDAFRVLRRGGRWPSTRRTGASPASSRLSSSIPTASTGTRPRSSRRSFRAPASTSSSARG